MLRVHISRNKLCLYLGLLGLATLILTLVVDFRRSVRPIDSIADIAGNLDNERNGSKDVYHELLHDNNDVATNMQPKQTSSGNAVYSIKEATWLNAMLTGNIESALKESQNESVVQSFVGGVDSKKEIQENASYMRMDIPQKSSSNEPHRIHTFLNDFTTYPCMKGLSEFPMEKWEADGKCVRTVNCTESARKIIPYHKCVDVRTPKGTLMPICVYPAEIDKWVSATIMRGNLWESDLIDKMSSFIRLEKQKHPDIEFLDLGSNIGCYSLYIAQEGINVTAIDPLHTNMELISKSILIGKVQDRIRLIWNAIADHHNIVTFLPDINNVGGTRIKDINPNGTKAIMDVARAITFDDLIPLFRGKHIAMKMDIEESEYPALIGGETFFQEVDVKVVQMEFEWHKKGKDGPKIVEYFSKKGYQPFRDLQRSMDLNSYHMATWPNDIYFMKPTIFDLISAHAPISAQSVLF